MRVAGLVPLCAMLVLLACGGSGTANYAGTYYVAIGPDPRFTMDVAQTGSAVTFEIVGAEVPISGTGTVANGVMEFEADLSGLGRFLARVEFTTDGSEFLGTWEVPEAPMQGTMTGSKEPWATWDPSQGDPPTFAVADCIDLDEIERVSRFRSGAGHDYSDDFESCRSMKHYFDPKPGVDFSTIRIYAPFAGTIVGRTEEWHGPSTWKGTALGIRPDGLDPFHVVLFHVDLHRSLEVGDRVAAGEDLGTSEKDDGTAADIAFGMHTPAGYRLVSYFQIMTNTVFQSYAARGVGARTDLIITEAARDADPLACDGQEFQGGGSLANWFDLN